MKVIASRSPYIIEINETNQIGSKLEIFIWHKGETEPTSPTYTLSKSITSIANRSNVYNISQYINENITIVAPVDVTTPTIEDNNAWCFVKVKKYKLIGSTYTLVDTLEFVGVDGYSNYVDGPNSLIANGGVAVLLQSGYSHEYSSRYGYLNLLITGTTLFPFNVTYLDNASVDYYLNDGEIYNYKIPFIYDDIHSSLVQLQQGVKPFRNIFVDQICEPKYTPIVCSFVNRFGGWNYLTFFKANQQSIDVKSSDFKLMPQNWIYDPLVGTNKSFNFNGKQKITCNTGWIDENKFQLIQDLLLSETILLDDVPVLCTTKNVDYKTRLKDKNINYTINFEYNFNLINDVI